MKKKVDSFKLIININKKIKLIKYIFNIIWEMNIIFTNIKII